MSSCVEFEDNLLIDLLNMLVDDCLISYAFKLLLDSSISHVYIWVKHFFKGLKTSELHYN